MANSLDDLPRYADILAPYASKADATRGRLAREPEGVGRSAFQRDRDRIIHSSAFRRLKHKTQVFVYHEGDHFRTRLTHSLEVAQIARSICRDLRLDEDLAEALALAHDLGHPPFGHAGERVLNDCMTDFGGFDHNAQAMRLVTRLEHRYASFTGLNLSWEALEGLAKHNGPVLDTADADQSDLPMGLRDFNADYDLELHTFASLEAQVAAIADDIAYSAHDLDDGLRAGLFDIKELSGMPLIAPLLDEVQWTYPDAPQAVLIHELVRRLINRLVADLLVETRKRLETLAPSSVDDVRAAERVTVAFSPEVEKSVRVVKDFLFGRMYRHFLVNRMTSKAKRVVKDLFDLYISEPECLPTEWQTIATGPGTTETARVAADFIAGMTDRFAFREHAKLFDLTKVTL